MGKKRRQPSKNTQIVAIVVFIGAILLFLFSGQDPFGYFEESSDSAGQPGSVTSEVSSSQGDGFWEVYFTDPVGVSSPDEFDNSVAAILIDYINQTQSSINIAAFEFNLTPVAEALIAAKQRGVKIRWVTDDEAGIDADEEEGHGQFAMLERAGIQVKDDQRSALMHNKFWIFDGKTVWTGSTNITQNGIFRNNNNVIVLHSREIAAIFEREFAEMWAGEFGPRSPSTVADQSAQLDGASIQVYFAAEDDVIDAIIPIIEGANESIHFMAFSFTHDELGDAMLERNIAGVNVSGIFETRGSETEFSELGTLYCAGTPVRQDGNPGTFHHKVVIVDGLIVITGSLNFSDNANDSNDENVVVIDSPEIAARYLSEFNRRWSEAEEPNPSDLECR